VLQRSRTEPMARKPLPDSRVSIAETRKRARVSTLISLLVTTSTSCASESETPSPQRCRQVLARRYDSQHKCFLAAATLPDLSFCQSINGASSGNGETSCVVDSSGVAYSTWKEYTECLPPGASGWTVYGLQGPCTQSVGSSPAAVCNQVVGNETIGPPAELPGAPCADM
jgi:hypothetical protein